MAGNLTLFAQKSRLTVGGRCTQNQSCKPCLLKETGKCVDRFRRDAEWEKSDEK
jgi:hypothetical protein